MPDVCLTLLCPPEIEEGLLDLLLLSSNTALFTSTATAAHGLEHQHLDRIEQVLGRADATQVQVILDDTDKVALLDAIRARFPDARLRYWVLPVLDAGELA